MLISRRCEIHRLDYDAAKLKRVADHPARFSRDKRNILRKNCSRKCLLQANDHRPVIYIVPCIRLE